MISETLLLKSTMMSCLRTLTDSRTLLVKTPGSKFSMSAVTTSQSRPHRW